MSKLNPLAAAIGAAVVSSSLSLGALAANPFQATDLSSGYQVADSHDKGPAEGKCGEGKCGEGMCGASDTHKHADEKNMEGKCGEGKCGEGMCGGSMEKHDDMDNKAGEGHDKGMEGKCGEGKCGGKKEG